MSHTEQLFSDAGKFESIADSASSITADQESTICFDELPADCESIRAVTVVLPQTLACATNRHIELAEEAASE